jgi:hypothetical protein
MFAEGTGAAEVQAQAQIEAQRNVAQTQQPGFVGQLMREATYEAPQAAPAPAAPRVDIFASLAHQARVSLGQTMMEQTAMSIVDTHEPAGGPNVVQRVWHGATGLVGSVWNAGATAIKDHNEAQKAAALMARNKEMAALNIQVAEASAGIEQARAEANRAAAAQQAQARWTARAQADATERTTGAQAAANERTAQAQGDLYERTERAKAWGVAQATQEFLRRFMFTDPERYNAGMNNMRGATAETPSANPQDQAAADPASSTGAAQGPVDATAFRVL